MQTKIQTPNCHVSGRRVLAALVTLAAGACNPAESSTSWGLDQTVLGTAQSFAVLAGETVTNTGPTIIEGDLGVHPGLAVTGFPPGIVAGAIHSGDDVALQAKTDLTAAYVALAGEASTASLTGQDLGGMTLVAGVYTFTSGAQLTGTLTLDAQGDPLATFLFQIGSTLTTASNATVLVINGGSPCNVYWQVGSSATIGTTTAFAGNIVALTSIALMTNASVNGRALARNGEVTLDSNEVSTLNCAVVPTGFDAAPTPTIDAEIIVPTVDAPCEIDAALPDATICDAPPPPPPPVDAECDAALETPGI